MSNKVSNIYSGNNNHLQSYAIESISNSDQKKGKSVQKNISANNETLSLVPSIEVFVISNTIESVSKLYIKKIFQYTTLKFRYA